MTDNLLEFRSVSKSYGSIKAVNELLLNLPRGALLVILGPAGAGKTTTLRMAAGLEIPEQGSVWLDGQDVTRLQPHQRDVAMIFDNLALYPNRTGFENIAFPLRLAKVRRAEIEQRVHAIGQKLKIDHILQRLPATFSGGERQRVALGRAMVRDPKIFLMDEPLSSLDFMLRIELRTELKRMQKELGKSFLYATPDYTEALALGDMVCVLLKGQIRQIASAQTLYERPADRDVARFVGNPPINLVPGRLERSNGKAQVRIGGLTLPVVPEAERALPGGISDVVVGIRPESVSIEETEKPGWHSAHVNDLEPLGMHTTLGVDLQGVNLSATVSGERKFREDQRVGVAVAHEKMIFFDPTTGLRLGAQ